MQKLLETSKVMSTFFTASLMNPNPIENKKKTLETLILEKKNKVVNLMVLILLLSTSSIDNTGRGEISEGKGIYGLNTRKRDDDKVFDSR